MFNVNNKNTGTTSATSFQTYFTPFSSVSIVDFEQVNFCWVSVASIQLHKKNKV